MEKDIQPNDTAVRKVSEKRKASNQKWDLENMRSISCRLRKEDAELFKEYCAENHTTPGAYLKNHIHEILDKYCEIK
jgi:hypothetical protein